MERRPAIRHPLAWGPQCRRASASGCCAVLCGVSRTCTIWTHASGTQSRHAALSHALARSSAWSGVDRFIAQIAIAWFPVPPSCAVCADAPAQQPHTNACSHGEGGGAGTPGQRIARTAQLSLVMQRSCLLHAARVSDPAGLAAVAAALGGWSCGGGPAGASAPNGGAQTAVLLHLPRSLLRSAASGCCPGDPRLVGPLSEHARIPFAASVHALMANSRHGTH